MKTALKVISLIVLFGAATSSHASALVNYPQSWYSGSCVTISNNLSYNARGAEVSRLQTFLVTQNFPGGGSWMVTGFFGGATEAAVRDFQQAQGLPASGVVDVSTRAAISRITCGGVLAYTNPSAPALVLPSVPANNYNNYFTYGYGNYVSLNLTSLSRNTGNVGSQVTIYGTGFDATNNTINFGTVALAGVPSDGTSLTFIVPNYTASGDVRINVTNGRGTSNSIVFSVNTYGSTCGNNYFYGYGSCNCSNPYSVGMYNGGTYNSGYQNNYGYGNGSNCGSNNPTGNSGNIMAPVLSYVTPISGGTGTTVTVMGSGFTSTGNSVRFGTGVISNLISSDGQSVSFVVPTQLTGYGTQNTGLGIYNVSVTNGAGYTTNSVPFTVTSLGNNSGSVAVTSIGGPTSIVPGTNGTWTVTLNNPSGNPITVSANWGDSNAYQYASNVAAQTTSAQGVVTLTFAHTYYTSGTYTLTFTANNTYGGTPSSATMTVAVGGSTYGSPSISYLAPSTGYVGTSVTIYGSNLSNISSILFGTGSLQGTYSSNGSSLTFIVPAYIAPYCANSGNLCPQYAQQVTPGTYNVSVVGMNGTSNTVPFTVL